MTWDLAFDLSHFLFKEFIQNCLLSLLVLYLQKLLNELRQTLIINFLLFILEQINRESLIERIAQISLISQVGFPGIFLDLIEISRSSSGGLVELGGQIEIVKINGVEDRTWGIDELWSWDVFHDINISLSPFRILHEFYPALLFLVVLFSEVQKLSSQNPVYELLNEVILLKEKWVEKFLKINILSYLQKGLLCISLSLHFHYGGLSLGGFPGKLFDLRIGGLS